ncbi:hypothetical protein SAMN04488026_106633 [Aliiruegeria lutimaris]|uniref:Lysophospholipase n=1 Tax=Aliiruegeria lutimaris TaxID=571298 RepID=A0A1G9H4I9_9RHOB|nr:hypothetical protein SAMN04488026_106633 [Aliiruegeria lutimaris]
MPLAFALRQEAATLYGLPVGESVDKHINLVKLCVGAERVEDLLLWQQTPRAHGPDGLPRHVTRMWPKRGEELLNGGSLYWVFKGLILARQRLLRLDEVLGGDGITRCALVLDPEVHRTESVPRRPFQGWRYLKPEDSPADLAEARQHEDTLPPELSAALAEIGVR